MNTNPSISTMKRPLGFALLSLVAVLLGGCASTWRAMTSDVLIDNLTPAVLPENPSGLYTFTASIRPGNANIDRTSIRPELVIDGQIFPMKPSPLGPNLWEYDHPITVGRGDARYYFQVNYVLQRDNRRIERTRTTDLIPLRVSNRYALSLEAVRGPVGATVGVLGRGFSQGDTVMVGDVAAATTWQSGTSLSFVVPPVAGDQVYRVRVTGLAGDFDVGAFRVDRGTLSVLPNNILLARGERQSLTVTLSGPAGPDGVLVDVTTDIPSSVIMAEVRIPAGQSSVTAPLQGGEPGTGSLFIEVPGFETVTVPVTVR